MTSFFIGTYPADGLGTPVGHGEGLWHAQVGDDGTLSASQVTVQPAPSFAVVHPRQPLLYAVEESTLTRVSAWSIEGQPREVARVDVGGSGGCHLLLSPDAATLYVSLYGSGEVAVIPLGLDGLPSSGQAAQTVSHHGSGPHADRQQGPHAHSAAFAPDGRHLLVADLGTDELRRYTVGEDGLLYEPAIAALLPPGAGPRHLAVRRDLLYVVCELDQRLRTLRWDRGSATAELIAEHPLTLAPCRTGEELYGAHVEVVSRGTNDVLLVSVRGADVISVFDVAPEGEVTYRAAFDCGVWPRHFAVVGQQLVVGAEQGHEVRAYSLTDVLTLPPEGERGAVAHVPHHRTAVTSPACIVPAAPAEITA